MNTKREVIESFLTKQDFLRPTTIPKDVLKEVALKTEKERKWYKKKNPFTEDKIKHALKTGELVSIISNEDVLVAKTVEHPYVTPEFEDVLFEIISKFKQMRPEDYLIIVSLLRSVEQQMKINPNIPASSVHNKGEGADLPGKWLEAYEPETANALKEILEEMHNKGKINFLIEETFGMWHISRNPNYES